MSMLAEPRRKQKFSVDPRGTAWSKDGSKFGQKLLEKFGWTKGKGLGAREDGNVEHVKVALKNDTRGVGCTKNHADNWIAHQDGFNDLLLSLNQDANQDSPGEDSTKVSGLEERSKASRSRVHYQKFTKGKDLSSKSSKDLACIFGKRETKSDIDPSPSQSEEDSSSDEQERTEHGVITVKSTDSVHEYFAKKMAEKRGVSSTTNVSGEIDEENKKTKKRVRFSLEENIVNICQEDDCEDKLRKKKKSKKSKRQKEDLEESDWHQNENTGDDKEQEVVESQLNKTVKPKRKRKHIAVEEQIESDEVSGSKKSKKNKKKNRSPEEIDPVTIENMKDEIQQEVSASENINNIDNENENLIKKKVTVDSSEDVVEDSSDSKVKEKKKKSKKSKRQKDNNSESVVEHNGSANDIKECTENEKDEDKVKSKHKRKHSLDMSEVENDGVKNVSSKKAKKNKKEKSSVEEQGIMLPDKMVETENKPDLLSKCSISVTTDELGEPELKKYKSKRKLGERKCAASNVTGGYLGYTPRQFPRKPNRKSSQIIQKVKKANRCFSGANSTKVVGYGGDCSFALAEEIVHQLERKSMRLELKEQTWQNSSRNCRTTVQTRQKWTAQQRNSNKNPHKYTRHPEKPVRRKTKQINT